MKLDFSQFHPSDHWPGTLYCRSLPGGIRNHLALAWEHRRRDQVRAPFRRWLFCPRGEHVIDVWYRRNGRCEPRCRFCPYTRLPSEADLDDRAAFMDDLDVD